VNISDAQYAALLRAQGRPARQRTTLPAPSEYEEQCAVIEWAHAMVGRWPELAFLFHVPNGEARPTGVGARLQRLGVQRGVPDLLLLEPRGAYHGLALELKRADHSNAPTPEQWCWLEHLRAVGYLAVVCYGAQAAIDALTHYLEEAPA
jgi:hypothetical protein